MNISAVFAGVRPKKQCVVAPADRFAVGIQMTKLIFLFYYMNVSCKKEEFWRGFRRIRSAFARFSGRIRAKIHSKTPALSAARSQNWQRMIVQLNQQTPVLHKKIIKNAEIHKKHTNMLDNTAFIAYNEKHNSKNHTILKGKNL